MVPFIDRDDRVWVVKAMGVDSNAAMDGPVNIEERFP
jgi:hypothetical protein